MRTVLLIACFLLAFPNVSTAQTQPAIARLSSQQLLADVEILKSAYEQLHPGVYRYNTKKQIDERFAALRKFFEQDRTRAEAFIEFSRFTASIQCGHTYANPHNQGKTVRSELLGGKNRLPFHFRWIDRRMIVINDAGNQIKVGSEVLSINEIPVATILEKMLPLSRADGANDAKRIRNLEIDGTKYAAFDVFMPLLFPQMTDRFAVSIREPDGQSRIITIEAIDASVRDGDKPKATNANESPWEARELSPQIAVLRMPTWAMYNSKWDWKKFLNDYFDSLIEEQTPNLVIDLRGNEGGDDVGNLIIARITTSEVALSSFLRHSRYRAAPTELHEYLDTWDKSFLDWADAVKPVENGFFRNTKYDDTADGDVIKPAGKRYAGKVFVLIDASNSSATGQFAAAIKQSKLATLVGQPTGGNQRGINGGAYFFLRLPNSRIELDLPLIATFPVGQSLPDGQSLPFESIPNAGVEPDIAVTPTHADIAAGVDSEMEAVKNLVGN